MNAKPWFPALRRFLVLLPALLVVGVTGCASKDKYAWTKDLPVEAETSIKGARRQELRLMQVFEQKTVDGQRWIRGPGFAAVNDRTSMYFWNSKQMPNLEITFAHPDDEAFKQCGILIDQMPTKRLALRIQGDGFFVSKGNEDDGFVGLFRIDRVTDCVLVPADATSTAT